MKPYINGLHISESLASNIRILLKRVGNKKAAMIIIDGGLGEGKTTLGIDCLDYVNSLHNLPEAELEGSQLAMGGVAFLKKIRVCYEKKLPCIVYDEAGDFSRRGSLTQFNSMLNRTFETFRAFKCLVILVLPNFDSLDKEILDKNIPRLLLHLKGRTSNSGNFYGYSLYRLQLLKYYMGKTSMKNYAYKKVHPNIYGHFQDLEPARAAALDKISTKNKLDILRKSEVKIEGLLTTAELAVKLMKSIPWVRNATKVLKIAPARIIHCTHYYNEDALNFLVEKMDILSMKGNPRHRNEPKDFNRGKWGK